MDIKTSFFDVMSEIQKDTEEVSAGIGNLKNLIYKNFVRNLMLKLMRSTLTSLGTIRVNINEIKVTPLLLKSNLPATVYNFRNTASIKQ